MLNRRNDTFKMFDQFIIVGLKADHMEPEDETGRYTPMVLSHYPIDTEVPNGIEKFCFPNDIYLTPVKSEYFFFIYN